MSDTTNRRAGQMARRKLLRCVGRATLGASATALLAACGDPELPEPPRASGRATSRDPQSVTQVVAVEGRDARPQERPSVTIGVPTGNPLFDQMSLRVTGLAADAMRTAEAPGDLSVVQFEQALNFNPSDLATAVEALLAKHPQLDALLIMNADDALLLAERGHVAPVNGPATSTSDFSADDFLPSAIDSLTVEGDLLGLPLWVSTNMVRYNPNRLIAAGVDPDNLRDWDWQQFQETARQLTIADAGGQPSQWGLFAAPGSLPSHQWIWQNGGSIVDLDARQTTLDTTAALEAVDFLRDLANDRVGPTLDFVSGQAATSISIVNGEMAVQGAPVAMFGSPVGGLLGGFFGMGLGGSSGLLVPPRQREAAVESEVFGVLGLLAGSADPDAAFQMLDWVATQIAPAGTVPARGPTAEQLRGQGGYSDTDAGAIMQAVKAARAIPGPYATHIKGVMLREVDAPIASGQTDPYSALTAAGDAINKLFEQSPGELFTQSGPSVEIRTGSATQVQTRGG